MEEEKGGQRSQGRGEVEKGAGRNGYNHYKVTKFTLEGGQVS